MKIYTHHVLCNALPGVPHGVSGCICWFCTKCQCQHIKNDIEACPGPIEKSKVYTLDLETLEAKAFAKYAADDAMATFLIGQDGKMHKLQDHPCKPCPECGGEASRLKQCHKMSCDGYFTLCPICWEWARTNNGTPHVCKKPEQPQPRVRPAFDIPPMPRPNRWFIEWRWKPRVWRKMIDDEPTQKFAVMLTVGNEWQPHDRLCGGKGFPTECMARNETATLRRRFPGKSFRYRGRRVTQVPF